MIRGGFVVGGWFMVGSWFVVGGWVSVGGGFMIWGWGGMMDGHLMISRSSMNNGLGCIDGLGSVDWGCVVNWLSMAISYWSWGVTINTSMNWSCCNCMMDSNGSCMVNGDSSISIGVSSDCQSNCSYYL